MGKTTFLNELRMISVENFFLCSIPRVPCLGPAISSLFDLILNECDSNPFTGIRERIKVYVISIRISEN